MVGESVHKEGTTTDAPLKGPLEVVQDRVYKTIAVYCGGCGKRGHRAEALGLFIGLTQDSIHESWTV